ncbi:MAG: hypothetical protein RLZZ500_1149 [Bacteroidota bacterium]|jgi:flavin reductase (DIM6/NTAB) family NADH-FMN oxidoreductase RutF
MKTITRSAFSQLAKVPRLNLINSCMGYKSANLIATVSEDGFENVAIFSSITHLGSDPALLGFIVRPTSVPRHTYNNIKTTGYFTVNAITANQIAQAHQTSAAYDYGVSEFEMTGLEAEYKEGVSVPFVAGSPLQLLCKYVNEYPIHENNTLHVIAAIEAIYVEDALLQDDYWIRLDQGNIVAINGLDGYAEPQLLNRFAYARPSNSLKSILKHES